MNRLFRVEFWTGDVYRGWSMNNVKMSIIEKTEYEKQIREMSGEV